MTGSTKPLIGVHFHDNLFEYGVLRTEQSVHSGSVFWNNSVCPPDVVLTEWNT